MRVLMQGRVDLLDNYGGDTSIILDLKRELKKFQIQAEIIPKLNVSCQNHDLVQLYGITRVHETYYQFLAAKKYGKKVVLITDYEPLDELDKKGRFGVQNLLFGIKNKNLKEFLKTTIKTTIDFRQLPAALEQLKVGYINQQRFLLTNADHLIFKSLSEFKTIKKDLKIKKMAPFTIIPNSVELSFVNSRKELFTKKFGLSNFILSVGRIEPKKNQLRLIKALENIDLPLVFIGKPSNFNKSYYNEFLKAVKKRKKTYYFKFVDSKLLGSAYAACKVHILPSWFEITGLANLEAALAGASIVSTNRGYVKDYLNNFAWYCNPLSDISIKKAVLSAYHSRPNNKLKNFILKNFSWEKNVKLYIEIYRHLLS